MFFCRHESRLDPDAERQLRGERGDMEICAEFVSGEPPHRTGGEVPAQSESIVERGGRRPGLREAGLGSGEEQKRCDRRRARDATASPQRRSMM
jgi:hypothetical protein